ncbi:hypothetical protein Tco_1553653 [Tanacetum coccineum]
MDLTAAAKNHFMELNELMELRDGAYKNNRVYKERTKNGMTLGSVGIQNLKLETSNTSPSPLIGGNPQGNHTWSDKKAQEGWLFTLEILTEESLTVTSRPGLEGASN